MEPDFSGYVTRYGVPCSDGRTILKHAFKANDGHRIPLVWQHDHKTPVQVLGHLLLAHRDDGVYATGFFNSTDEGQRAKVLVTHKDIDKLSIFANELRQSGLNVTQGNIREGSLVIAGANPGAFIDNVYIQHSDGSEDVLEGEAIIGTGEPVELSHAVTGTAAAAPAAKSPGSMTVEEIFNTLTDVQKNAVYALIGAAVDNAQHSATQALPADATASDILSTLDEVQAGAVRELLGRALSHNATSPDQKGDTPVTRNVFDQTDANNPAPPQAQTLTLSHEDVKGIIADAIKGGSLKAACVDYAIKHNVDNVDLMFPEAKLIQDTPDFISRRTEWVAGVLAGTRKSPFSRIKSILADITQDEARAKGYIKGNMKREEFFGVSRRTTTPTTVYKKQKLDRDDIVDITDFDMVNWIKGEMRLMLDEEVARAILIGDGRDVSDQDKVKDPVGASDGAGIRSILNDHEMYVSTVYVNIDDASSSPDEIVDAVVGGMRFFRGTGMPTFYTTLPYVTKLILAKDTLNRRLYRDKAELASSMLVRDIVDVEPMEQEDDLIGIVVNLNDYNVGTDKGGEVNYFDQFDIDFNQNKYLIETRLSGALVKYKSAVVVKKVASSDVLVDPVDSPTFVETTGVVTIPTQTGVVYKNADTAATLSGGAQTALGSGDTLNVQATPASGYYFASNAEDQWSFTRP